MKAAFEKFGGEIDMSEEAVYEMWESDPNAFGETLSSKYIRMSPNPDTATVFEEFIHATQFRTGEYARLAQEFGEDLGMMRLEIMAQEKLLANSREWGIPREEVIRIRTRLTSLLTTYRRLNEK